MESDRHERKPSESDSLTQRIKNWLEIRYQDKPFFRDMTLDSAYEASQLLGYLSNVPLFSGLLLLYLPAVGIPFLVIGILLAITGLFIQHVYCVCPHCGKPINDCRRDPMSGYCSFCGSKLEESDTHLL